MMNVLVFSAKFYIYKSSTDRGEIEREKEGEKEEEKEGEKESESDRKRKRHGKKVRKREVKRERELQIEMKFYFPEKILTLNSRK